MFRPAKCKACASCLPGHINGVGVLHASFLVSTGTNWTFLPPPPPNPFSKLKDVYEQACQASTLAHSNSLHVLCTVSFITKWKVNLKKRKLWTHRHISYVSDVQHSYEPMHTQPTPTHRHTKSIKPFFQDFNCELQDFLFALFSSADKMWQRAATERQSFNTILPFHGDRAGYCLHTTQKQFSNVSDQRQKFCSAEQSGQIVLNITIPRKCSEQRQKHIPPLNLLIREIKHTVQPEVIPKLKCHSDKNNWEHVKMEKKKTFQLRQAKPVLAYPALPMSLLIFSMFT